ncbi:hypothetical protein PVAND_002153 [Polypedilum vanderplanki]|uniref:Uncharacterized protein n=1 Tax=Polypedilum vanderplanki TaxID=319348 RepID=A0A9J6BQP9_POLVA|nr:hypothetical protein PVAND_002153 [Polypedilum vanderplanki]
MNSNSSIDQDKEKFHLLQLEIVKHHTLMMRTQSNLDDVLALLSIFYGISFQVIKKKFFSMTSHNLCVTK